MRETENKAGLSVTLVSNSSKKRERLRRRRGDYRLNVACQNLLLLFCQGKRKKGELVMWTQLVYAS